MEIGLVAIAITPFIAIVAILAVSLYETRTEKDSEDSTDEDNKKKDDEETE